jgi:putative transferase (TIGR04331 family)
MTSFHISTIIEFWEKRKENVFIAEPFVAYELKLAASNNLHIEPYSRKTKEDYIYDNNLVHRKLKKYLPLLCSELNKIHGRNYSSQFWSKSLSMGLLRYISTLYDAFKMFQNFDPTRHTVSILNDESYIVPKTFEEFRNIFQYSEFGYEQLFSLYIKIFYPDLFFSFEKVSLDYNAFSNRESVQRLNVGLKVKIIQKFKKISPVNVCLKLARPFFLKIRKPNIVVYHSFFDKKYLLKLILKSLGRINQLNIALYTVFKKPLSNSMRKSFLKDIKVEDDFEHFFMECTQYIFPKFYLEEYQEIESYYENIVRNQRGLRTIISEAWIGNMQMAYFIALLQKNGVKHVYNEHNFIEHPVLGNSNSFKAENVDIFYTLGWYDEDTPNIVKGASLFSFKNRSQPKKKKFKYLYIASSAMPKLGEVSSTYAQSAENSIRYINFISEFLNSLAKNVLNEMVLRKYPNQNWIQYNLDYILADILPKLRMVDDYKLTSREMMVRSRLLIIDYLATSYLEAMIMNIPVIILFDPDRYYLKDKYKDFFKELISAGVFQTDPEGASRFVSDLNDDIEKWWFSEKVQNARKHFLDQNIGRPETAIRYYLGLLN